MRRLNKKIPAGEANFVSMAAKSKSVSFFDNSRCSSIKAMSGARSMRNQCSHCNNAVIFKIHKVWGPIIIIVTLALDKSNQP